MTIDLSKTVVRVLDTETTGFPPKGEVVEMAYIDLIAHKDSWATLGSATQLYKPGHPIPEGARKVHGITDEMVADAVPTIMARGDAMSIEGQGKSIVYVAHNRDFDAKMLGMEGLPWICTLKLARRAFKDAPNHKLETLREHLNLEVCFPDGWETNAHRAGYDTAVCAALFTHLVSPAKLSDGIEGPTQLARQAQVPFGKHKGKQWQELPDGYLSWLMQQDWPSRDVKMSANNEIKSRQGGLI